MGVLNVTPDSFSDGGAYGSVQAALSRALEMQAEGAAIIDVGGESTRPGARPVSVDDEVARVVPVIEVIRRAAPDLPISIDTTKARVAALALRAGADMINDISGLHFDGGMAQVAADAGVPVVCMHIQGEPRTMQAAPHYDDLVGEVAAWLRQSVALAERAGLARDQIVIDPGIGFGKTAAHNLALIRRLPELIAATGCPALLGPSRKSFLGHVLDQPDPGRRLFGTAAAVAAAVRAGARFVRVHDVGPMRDVIAVTRAIEAA